MKKKTKKLVLTKETVRKLEAGQLVEAAGGSLHSCGDPAGGGRICWDVEPSIAVGC